MAQELGFPLRVIPIREEYIQMLKNPRYGYGKNLNPCIDCRILFLSKARAIMEEEQAYFIFTGEVLGERPFSQNLMAMRIIERESGLDGLLLRPLSAKLLPPTKPEIEGIVDRERLLAIKGRSRRPQIALAERLGIKEYPTPAGGCLLTNKEFSAKVKDALAFGEDSPEEIEQLKIGRHFRLKSSAKVIVGRNEEENKILLLLVKDGIVLKPRDVVGPITILKKGKDFTDIEIAASLCARYSDGRNQDKVAVIYDDKVITVKPLSEEVIRTIRIG